QAIDIVEREPEPNEASLTVALIAVGVSWLERGRAGLAGAPPQRARRDGRNKTLTLEPAQLGQARFALARALAASKAPPARVLVLAVAARAAFESSPRHAVP